MDLIYHHTTAEGLIGILNGQCIWATDIGFLNDYEEYKTGICEIKRVCDEQKISLEGRDHYVAAAAFYDATLNILPNLDQRSSFITSFTKTKDNLRQWMSYGRPNASYSIGFDPEILKKMSLDKDKYKSDHLAFSMELVTYSDITPIAEILCFDNIKKMLQANDRSDLNNIVQTIANRLMFGACSIKRKEFADEAEIRMIFQTRKIDTPYAETKFRDWGGIVVPYLSIQIPSESIKEIIIGPNINKELARAGLDKLVKKNKIDCRVLHSECTLRQY